MSDPTLIDPPAPPTQAIPAQPEAPRRKPMEPMDPEDRSILLGVLGVVTLVAASITAWVHFASTSNVQKAEEKTDQVTACTKIEEGTAALACVVQIDE